MDSPIVAAGLLTILAALSAVPAQSEVHEAGKYQLPHGMNPIIIWAQPGKPEIFPSLTETATAVLKCTVTEQLTLSACNSLDETPSGQGVAEKSVMVAEKMRFSVIKPRDVGPSDEVIIPMVFAVPHDSAGSFEKLTRATHTIEKPSLLEKPSADEMEELFPNRARMLDKTGFANVICIITANGDPRFCSVEEESPSDFGFGAAAIKIVQRHKFRPYLYNGVPLGGASVRVPIVFGFAAPK